MLIFCTLELAEFQPVLPLGRQLGRMGPIQEEVGCKMDNFLLLVIGVLFILSAGFLILYF
jgi:hypothetical protein